MGPKKYLIIALAVLAALAVAAYVLIASYDYNYLKPRLARAVKELTGRDLTLGGNIKLDISLVPALTVQDLALSNASWGSRPQMLTVKRAELEVKLLPLLSGKLVVRRLILTEPDLLIETDKNGHSNLDLGRPQSGPGHGAGARAGERRQGAGAAKETGTTVTPTSIPSFWLKRLALQHAKISYRDRRSGVSRELYLRTLEAEADSADGRIGLDARGRLDGTAFNLDGSVGSLRSAMDPSRPWPVDLSLEAAGATLAVKGSFTDLAGLHGLKLALKLEGNELANLSGLAGRRLPKLGAYRLTGDIIDTGRRTFRMSDLKMDLADNVLDGWVRADLGGDRPALQAELNSQRLSLLPLAELKKETGPPAGREEGSSRGQGSGAAGTAGKQEPGKRPGGNTAAGERIFSQRLIPLGWMGSMDADLRFRARKLIAPRLAMEHLNLHLRLDHGRLKLAPLGALVGNGRLGAELELEPRGKDGAALHLSLRLAGCDLAAMLEQLGRDEGLGGKLDCDLDLTSSGPASLAGMMAGLNGKAVLTIDQGRIHNRYINLLGGDLPKELLRLLNPSQSQDGYTKFDCAVAGFAPKHGLAPITALVLNTPAMTVVGRGQVDLRSERLDVGVTPYPKTAPGAEQNQVSLSLGELLKPLKLAGTLARPRVTLDQARTAQTLGKAIAGFKRFGAEGLAAALTSGEGEVLDPCAQAKAAARAGRTYTPRFQQPQQQSGAPAQQGSQKQTGPQSPLDQLPEAIKGLFGR